jgi:hypothetical protein
VLFRSVGLTDCHRGLTDCHRGRPGANTPKQNARHDPWKDSQLSADQSNQSPWKTAWWVNSAPVKRVSLEQFGMSH